MNKEQEAIKKIIANYQNLEQSLVQQLQLEVHGHAPTTGTYREEVWKGLFEKIIPKKFCISQGVFIIDSKGHISREVDLAIYDEQYTPYIFNYGKIKFIPIEAAAVVIQCKSINPDKANLSEWVDKIKNLKTSLNAVVRVMGQLVNNNDKDSKFRKGQSATRPIRILCCTVQTKSISKEIADLFDITLHIDKNGSRLIKTMPNENNDYAFWHKDLNNPELSIDDMSKKLSDLNIDHEGNNVILSLIFQLNQLLMIINNPMLFPHQSYSDMFRKCIEENEREERGEK
jgi:hypothetical protein